MLFPTSPWTQLAMLSDDEKREDILRKFCELYAGPIYAFVSWKYPNLNSGDLTQDVLAHILSKNLLEKANRERGRLRTYLKTIIRSVASTSWSTKTKIEKVELPTVDIEACKAFASSLSAKPHLHLDVLLARQTFRRSLKRLRKHYAAQGRDKAFAVLVERCLDDETQDGAKKLGISAGAMRVQLYRFRKRLRDAFDAEVQGAVVDPKMVAEERDYLLRLLSEHGLAEE